MVKETECVILDSSVRQRNAAMGAMFGQQAVLALTIAEQNEIFAEQLKRANSLLVNLRLGGERPPVAAKKVPQWRARFYAAEQLVLLFRQHRRSSPSPTTIAGGQGDSLAHIQC